MATVYLGLGSNVAPEKNLKRGIQELRDRYGSLETSAVYRSSAIGFEGDDFWNLVVRMQSDDLPLSICAQIEIIHNAAGRERGSKKWASRTLDIDLLLYNDLICDEQPVRVPREDILKYSFVLRPMAELAPNVLHPVTGKTMLEHWQEFDASSHPLTMLNIEL